MSGAKLPDRTGKLSGSALAGNGLVELTDPLLIRSATTLWRHMSLIHQCTLITDLDIPLLPNVTEKLRVNPEGTNFAYRNDFTGRDILTIIVLFLLSHGGTEHHHHLNGFGVDHLAALLLGLDRNDIRTDDLKVQFLTSARGQRIRVVLISESRCPCGGVGVLYHSGIDNLVDSGVFTLSLSRASTGGTGSTGFVTHSYACLPYVIVPSQYILRG